MHTPPRSVSRLLVGAATLLALDAIVFARHRGPYPPVTLFHQTPRAVVLGTISGRVTVADGKPAAGYNVAAFPATGPFLRFNRGNLNRTTTDANGDYALMLQPIVVTIWNGPYLPKAKGDTVFVSDDGQPNVELASQNVDPKARRDHRITQVNFVLYPHSWGSVE